MITWKNCWFMPQAKTFVMGRHGMRQHPGIAKPRDAQQGLARLGLSRVMPGWMSRWLSDPAVPAWMTVGEARLPMHADADPAMAIDCGSCHGEHNLDTVRAAVEACASCHMPKLEHRRQVRTTHNQNDNLRPNEKMIRTVCLDCHSLGFSLDALADAGRQTTHAPPLLGWVFTQSGIYCSHRSHCCLPPWR